MNRARPIRPTYGRDANMYDDQPQPDDYDYHRRRSPSQGYQNSRKDNSRTPPRGPAGNRIYNPAVPERLDRGGESSRSPRREGRSRYADRDRESYRSPARNRSRSRSRSPYFEGPRSRTVILEGLPMDMTQEDGLAVLAVASDLQISYELKHSLRAEGLEEVRLIKDKKTGLSRQFAFAQFVAVSEARNFLDRYYPTISLYGGYDSSQATPIEPAKVRISFSREKDDRDRARKGEDDWKCEICYLANYAHRTLCFRCNAPKMRATAHGVVVAQTNMSSFSGFATTGDSDASPDSTASQFILLRGLEPGVSEELLAKGVSKLYKRKASSPPTDSHTAMKTKISSTSSDANLGARDGSLRQVLLIRDRKTNDSWRYGFAEFNTVEDAQAAMAKYNASDKFTISSKPVLLSYIHAGVFVPVLHPVCTEFSRFTFSPLSNPSVKLMYWDEAAYASKFTVSVVDQSSGIKNIENGHAKLAAAAANEGLVGAGKEGEPKGKKRKVDKDPVLSTKKVVAPHLQFWTNRHAELHGLSSKDDDSSALEPSPITPDNSSGAVINAPPSQSFADRDRKCCLLCSRQFKTEAEVNKHERISQLHRDNMKNEELVAKTLNKLSKFTEAALEGSTYRDRAKERRQAFNQPKQPATQHNRAPKEPNADSSQKKEEEAPAPQSKGAALLGKMGWTAGEGLGAQGTGRTEAIMTELYSQGVGLGAQGGKVGDAAEEAQRQTKGTYADFLSKTKDKAKERFESLG